MVREVVTHEVDPEERAAGARLEDDAGTLFELHPQVVIAYEDFEAAAKARNTLDRLLKHSCGNVPATASFWKFDLLNYPDLFNQALADGVRASIIILSVHGRCELPPQVTGWIERTIRHRTDDSTALVILFDESSEQTSTANHILAWLQSVATAGEFELIASFSNSGDDLLTLTSRSGHALE